MDKIATNRRDFLSGAGGAFGLALVATHWPAIAAAHAHAAVAAADPGEARLGFLTGDDARDVEAIAAQVIPSDDSPGAREAGALYFIDRSLQTWQSAQGGNFRLGLKDFQQRFAAAHPGPRFADADSGTQISFLVSIESGDFFQGVRALTLIGLFALPQYGGNRDGIGWRLIGFNDQHAFTPPFGFYDRDYPGFTRPDGKP